MVSTAKVIEIDQRNFLNYFRYVVNEIQLSFMLNSMSFLQLYFLNQI